MRKSNNPIDEELLMKKFKMYESTRSTSIRNEIIEMNLPLVEFAINKDLNGIKIKKQLKEELISIGIFGLINAVETYDVDYGAAFSSYAVECIKNYIKRNIHTVTDINRRTFNYPILDSIYRIERYNNIKLEDHLNELDEILRECTFIDESIKDKVKKYLLTRNCEYSDDNINETYEIEDASINDVLIEEMQKELDNLPENEREVLRHRYGFYGSVHTLDDIGKYMGCSHQNISRTEKKALAKLRKKNE